MYDIVDSGLRLKGNLLRITCAITMYGCRRPKEQFGSCAGFGFASRKDSELGGKGRWRHGCLTEQRSVLPKRLRGDLSRWYLAHSIDDLSWEGHVSNEVPEKPLVVVWTDDVDFFLLLDHIVQSEGLALHLASDLEEIRQLAEGETPSVFLIDCRSQPVSAAERCVPLKEHVETKDTPAVALIDSGSEREYVELMKIGIDDVFVKPVSPMKLVDCLRRMTRQRQRGSNAAVIDNDAVQYADLEMDLATYRVKRGGSSIHLSPTEFRLLRHFLEHPEQVVTREELKNAAWQENVHVGPRTVDVHVGRLRKALLSVSKKDLIRTVRSVGYALSDHNQPDSTSTS